MDPLMSLFALTYRHAMSRCVCSQCACCANRGGSAYDRLAWLVMQRQSTLVQAVEATARWDVSHRRRPLRESPGRCARCALFVYTGKARVRAASLQSNQTVIRLKCLLSDPRPCKLTRRRLDSLRSTRPDYMYDCATPASRCWTGSNRSSGENSTACNAVERLERLNRDCVPLCNSY